MAFARHAFDDFVRRRAIHILHRSDSKTRVDRCQRFELPVMRGNHHARIALVEETLQDGLSTRTKARLRPARMERRIKGGGLRGKEEKERTTGRIDAQGCPCGKMSQAARWVERACVDTGLPLLAMFSRISRTSAQVLMPGLGMELPSRLSCIQMSPSKDTPRNTRIMQTHHHSRITLHASRITHHASRIAPEPVLSLARGRCRNRFRQAESTIFPCRTRPWC